MMDLKSLHILHVVGSLQGGAAQHMYYLSQGLIKEGVTVSIAAPSDNAALKLKFDFSGCLVHDVSLDHKWPFKPTRQLKTLFQQENFSHIHVHGVRAAYLARRALQEGDPPLIYTVHGYHPKYYTSTFQRKMANKAEQKLEPKTTAYLAVSQNTLDDLLSVVPHVDGKSIVIPNAVPKQRLCEEEYHLARKKIRRELGIDENQFVIGTLARLQWQKGIDLLLDVQHTLLEQGNQQSVIIAGDGPDKKKLQEQCNNLGLEHSVKFLGHREKAYHVYAAMDVFVLPSLWEGMPLTVLEAWDAGIPVVVSDVPGNRELVTHNANGLCVERNADSLAEAITRIRKDVNLRQTLIQNGRTDFDEEFSIETMIQYNLRVYDEISALE